MVPLSTLAAVALASYVLAVIPGPAVLYIVARSLHQGRRAGALSAIGVALGGLVHVTLAVVGVGALLASSPRAYGAVRWAGALYLAWLGVRTVVAKAPPAEVAPPPAAPPRRLVADGFVVNVLNPKTALFFLAFLPQFVEPARGAAAPQLLALGLTFCAVAAASDVTYALLAGTLAGRLPSSGRSRGALRWASGGVYLALAAVAALGGRG